MCLIDQDRCIGSSTQIRSQPQILHHNPGSSILGSIVQRERRRWRRPSPQIPSDYDVPPPRRHFIYLGLCGSPSRPHRSGHRCIVESSSSCVSANEENSGFATNMRFAFVHSCLDCPSTVGNFSRLRYSTRTSRSAAAVE
jgi:hypothetical protein